MHTSATEPSFHADLLRSLPDGIVWAMPVLEGKEVTDFEIAFSNQKSDEATAHPAGSLMGLRILRDGVPSNEFAQQNFHHFLQVHQSGIAQEFRFVSNTGSAIETQRTPFSGGVLSVIRDREALRTAEKNEAEKAGLITDVLESSPNAIYILQAVRNVEGRIEDFLILQANKRYQELTGTPLKAMIGQQLLVRFPQAGENGFWDRLLDTVQTGSSGWHQIRSSISNKWFEYMIVRLRADRVMVTFHDITAIKEAQTQTEWSAQRLRAVFNASQSGMFIFAPERNAEGEVMDFRFVMTNKRFAGYVGQAPDVLDGELGSTWFPGYLTNGVFDMYKQTYLTGETLRQDVHYNVDGHDLYLDLMSTKVGDEVLVTFTDYTPLKNAQLQLERNIEELRRSNANLEEFAYAASHDMKEPIRKVQFFADRLRHLLSDRLNDQEAHLFSRMELAAERMGSLIDDLLTYSHISRGTDGMEDLDLGVKISTVLSDLELAIQDKAAVIEVGYMPKLKGHRRQLQQLFQNLIGNALKYAAPGVPPHIRITAKKQQGRDTTAMASPETADRWYHLVTVTDNGIGFEQKDAGRIFNVFQRLHGNAEFKGTGVGLSIAQKVAQNHRGIITAEGKPGIGAVFTVYLPAD